MGGLSNSSSNMAAPDRDQALQVAAAGPCLPWLAALTMVRRDRPFSRAPGGLSVPECAAREALS